MDQALDERWVVLKRLHAQQRLAREFGAHRLSSHHVRIERLHDLVDRIVGLAGEAGARRVLVLRSVEPDALDRHRLLDDAQHRFDERGLPSASFERCRDGGVLLVDSIARAVLAMLDPPCELDRRASAWAGRRPAIGEDLAGPFTGVFGEPGKPRSHGGRRTGDRLADVDLPRRVGGVGDVELDAGQPV